MWSTERNTYRGTLGSTFVAAVDVDPTIGPWDWADNDLDDDRGTVSLTFNGEPVAVTAKPEAGHLLSCLLNWASTMTTGQPFAGRWDTDQIEHDAGLRTLTANRHPVAVFHDTDLAETAAASLNMLPDQINTSIGAIAAVTDISGWSNPEPVWTLPDVDLCREALANAGLTSDEIASIGTGGQQRLREAARITSLLTEHLAWEDTSKWWRHPSRASDESIVTPLSLFVEGDDESVAAALASAPLVAAQLATRLR